MNNGIIATLIGLIVTVAALSAADIGESKKEIRENWLNVPLGVKPMPVVQNCSTGQMNALRKGSNFYQVPPTFQNQLSPRFSSEGCYGSFIRYNLPNAAHLGVPNDPLSFGDMAASCPSNGNVENFTKEDYCGSCNVQGCGKGGLSCGPQSKPKAALNMMGANYADLSYHNAQASLPTAGDVVDQLPVSGMDSLGVDGSSGCAEGGQPIVYDRFVYGLQKSRLHGLGDFIRGDLPIAQCNVGGGAWFTPAVNPQFDLNTGAMAVMGGLDMETPRATYALVNAASGGQDTALGGGDLSHALNMATSQSGCSASAGTDLNFTSFP